MVKVNQESRRKVFEIQIESPRAVRQSIVGAGNMNLLEAPPSSGKLDQLARANQACIHHFCIQTFFTPTILTSA